MAIKAGDDAGDMMSEINITPFTDVLLVLLIIFMVAATATMQNAFNMNLPKTTTTVSADQVKDLVIHVTKDDKLYVGEKLTADSELLPLLERMRANTNSDKVIIMVDGKVRYSRLIEVMDKAKAARLTSIALATTPE
jgi:biopolymer transport protein ExbD